MEEREEHWTRAEGPEDRRAGDGLRQTSWPVDKLTSGQGRQKREVERPRGSVDQSKQTGPAAGYLGRGVIHRALLI